MTLEEIASILALHNPRLLERGERRGAAVALLLRPSETGPEVLFIERATRVDDPWSGDLGFPGGKVEAFDGGARQAAVRETLEEIGVDLNDAVFLGHLGDITGMSLPVHVACYVFALTAPVALRLNPEVREAFWVSLAELSAPERHRISSVTFRGKTIESPGIVLPLSGKPVLWGLTYRLVMEFLRILRENDRPAPAPSEPAAAGTDSRSP